MQDGTRLTLLTVSDEGVGPPTELRKLLFERFRKGQQSTHGSGLGLTIVQEIASQHGGKAEFLQTPLCTVAVMLPAVSHTSSVSTHVSDKGLTGRIVASRSERQKS
jgi:signal transduction histidine kinase